ncbi:hypothetical protein GCM10009560_54580 [Nonomuraea longicatena]|uniref:Uncharacterized protein n=1 Tax=Nonomuraea longicatena TaxID=83682 RepID=A0ABP4B046_9ACTN
MGILEDLRDPLPVGVGGAQFVRLRHTVGGVPLLASGGLPLLCDALADLGQSRQP